MKILTKPREPDFKTDHRNKMKEAPLSTEEIILKQIKEKGAFKAKPIDKKIFEKVVGVP